MVAVAFGEPGAESLARRIEDINTDHGLLSGMSWIFPDRRLTDEFQRVLSARPLRGADLWHLATALYVAEAPSDIDFLTLDAAQRDAAAALGFSTPV